MTESELVLAEQKLNDKDSVIARLKQEMADMAVAHMNEMRREKEVILSTNINSFRCI